MNPATCSSNPTPALEAPSTLHLVLSSPFYYCPTLITAILCDFIPFCDELFKIVPFFAPNRMALGTIPGSQLIGGYDQMALPATELCGVVHQKGHYLVSTFGHEKESYDTLGR